MRLRSFIAHGVHISGYSMFNVRWVYIHYTCMYMNANSQLFTTNNNNLNFCAKSFGNNVEIIMASHLRSLSHLEHVLFILSSLPFVFVIFLSLAYSFVLVLFRSIFLKFYLHKLRPPMSSILCAVHCAYIYVHFIFHTEPFSGSMGYDIYLRMIHFCRRERIISIFISSLHWMCLFLFCCCHFLYFYLSISVVISVVWLSAVNVFVQLITILYVYNTFICRWFDDNLRLS